MFCCDSFSRHFPGPGRGEGAQDLGMATQGTRGVLMPQVNYFGNNGCAAFLAIPN